LLHNDKCGFAWFVIYDAAGQPVQFVAEYHKRSNHDEYMTPTASLWIEETLLVDFGHSDTEPPDPNAEDTTTDREGVRVNLALLDSVRTQFMLCVIGDTNRSRYCLDSAAIDSAASHRIRQQRYSPQLPLSY